MLELNELGSNTDLTNFSDELLDFLENGNETENLIDQEPNNDITTNIVNSEPEIYALDRVEGDFGVLENRETGELEDVPIDDLPGTLSDGDIFEYFDGVFERNDDLRQELLESIDSLRESVTY